MVAVAVAVVEVVLEELCTGVGGVASSNVSGYNGGSGTARGGGNGSESKRVVVLVVEGVVVVCWW